MVIAVQEASDAASSSCGLGPESLPPWLSGSSAVIVWRRTLTSWRRSSSWRAVARMWPMMLVPVERVEDEAGEDLREEVRGLRRHHLAGRRDLAHEVDGGGSHEQAGLDVAGADALDRLGRRARVVQSAEVADVVLAHAQGALEQEGLRDRGVEPAVGRGLAREGGVGRRRVLEREPERAAVVGVEVTDADAAVGGGLGLERVGRDLLDVPVAHDRVA